MWREKRYRTLQGELTDEQASLWSFILLKFKLIWWWGDHLRGYSNFSSVAQTSIFVFAVYFSLRDATWRTTSGEHYHDMSVTSEGLVVSVAGFRLPQWGWPSPNTNCSMRPRRCATTAQFKLTATYIIIRFSRRRLTADQPAFIKWQSHWNWVHWNSATLGMSSPSNLLLILYGRNTNGCGEVTTYNVTNYKLQF